MKIDTPLHDVLSMYLTVEISCIERCAMSMAKWISQLACYSCNFVSSRSNISSSYEKMGKDIFAVHYQLSLQSALYGVVQYDRLCCTVCNLIGEVRMYNNPVQ